MIATVETGGGGYVLWLYQIMRALRHKRGRLPALPPSKDEINSSGTVLPRSILQRQGNWVEGGYYLVFHLLMEGMVRENCRWRSIKTKYPTLSQI